VKSSPGNRLKKSWQGRSDYTGALAKLLPFQRAD
jgi:hypothetical protein